MKKILLILAMGMAVIGCASGNSTKIVQVYRDGSNKQCFYLENSYGGQETGVYCKQ